MRVQIITLQLSIALLVCSAAIAEAPRKLNDDEFAQLHQLIRPQQGESRWMEIEWYPSVWEARQEAAATGKPLFLMAGSGGAPAAGC